MASIAKFNSRRGGVRREIWVTLPDGRRRPIRLGKMRLKDVETIKTNVEYLVAAKYSGQPIEPSVAAWLGDCSRKLHKRLVALGLASQRSNAIESPPLGAWIDAYLDGNKDLGVQAHPMKPRTRLNFNQVRGWLIDYFTEEKRLDAITAFDAEQWRDWLAKQGKQKRSLPDGTKITRTLDKNTIRKHCQRAGQILSAAVKKRLLAENPFEGMRDLTMRVSGDRDHFVTAEEASKVLTSCRDNRWALLFALVRYGGLRPGEVRELRWCDVS